MARKPLTSDQKERRAAQRRDRYHNDPEYRERVLSGVTSRYHSTKDKITDEEKERKSLQKKEWELNNPEYLKLKAIRTKEKRAGDPEYRDRINASTAEYMRKRYATDPEHREKIKLRHREWRNKQVRREFSGRALKPIKGKAVVAFEMSYPSIREAMRALNTKASHSSVVRWMREGISPEEALTRSPGVGLYDGIIYCATNKTTGKMYVGLTTQTIERRWVQHFKSSKCGSTTPLHAAIRKYGSEGFELVEIDRGKDLSELVEKEKFWISTLSTIVPKGLNATSGGEIGFRRDSSVQ